MVTEVRFFGNGKLLGSAPKGNIESLVVVNPGNGFGQNPPTITITGGGGTGAQATPVLDENGTLLGVTITNPGFGYLSPPL